MKFINYIFHHEFGTLAVNIQDGIVYVDDEDKVATFKCPCGCGDVIALNLIPNTKPSWSVSGNTITPSINRTARCKSHFSITNGKVH